MYDYDLENACVEEHSKTINARSKLIQYKWLNILNIPPVELSRYKRNILRVLLNVLKAEVHFSTVSGI